MGFFRMQRTAGRLRSAAFFFLTALLASLVSAMPCTGIVGAPIGQAYAVSSSDSSNAATASSTDVSVSSDGTAATASGFSFACDEFSRAQMGSDRQVGGAYHGYTYYCGDEPSRLALIATSSDVIVYVPSDVANDLGIHVSNDSNGGNAADNADASDNADAAALKSMLIALDAANAQGGQAVDANLNWHFTDQTSYTLGDVVYSFDQELVPGRRYACVIGADGSDATSTSSASRVNLSHACFARLTPSAEIKGMAQPTALQRAQSFLSSIDYSPLWVTLRTTGVAIVFIFVFGLAAAYWCMNVSSRTRDVFDAFFTIPMVLPPTVCGFLLLLLLGNNTAIGRWFISIGFPLIFSWPATVIAAVVVAFPLMYRSARGAFESLDPDMLDAARTLGWSNRRVFFKLMLPLAWGNIASGTVLAFARALGEFGATLFLAGNYLGVTRTIPIAIYFEWMNGNTDIALFWTGVILVFSFIVILFINLWGRHTVRYRKKATKE